MVNAADDILFQIIRELFTPSAKALITFGYPERFKLQVLSALTPSR